MNFRKAFGHLGGGLRPSPAPSLVPALARRREIFGPHELRESRIRATSDFMDDLAPSARREIRDRTGGFA